MGLIEEVTKMQQEGMSSQDISIALQNQGVDKRKISEILSQSTIKGAVTKEDGPATISEYSRDNDMEQSVMSPAYSAPIHEEGEEVTHQEAKPDTNYVDYNQFSSQQNQGYSEPRMQPYQGEYSQGDSFQSSDNISEIAEQVFDEKISTLSKKVEFVLDSKNEFEAKLESISARLQKVEKIIDRLQLSVLQKVGEYMTNVEDIKRDLSETQKSFKYILKDKGQSTQQN